MMLFLKIVSTLCILLPLILIIWSSIKDHFIDALFLIITPLILYWMWVL